MERSLVIALAAAAVLVLVLTAVAGFAVWRAIEDTDGNVDSDVEGYEVPAEDQQRSGGSLFVARSPWASSSA